MKEEQPLVCSVDRDHRALPGCLLCCVCGLGRSGAGEGVSRGRCLAADPHSTQRALGCSFDCSCAGRMCWGALHPPVSGLCLTTDCKHLLGARD